MIDASTIADSSVVPPQPHRAPQPGEPTTLVELFEHVERAHPRSDTLNYKRDGQWISISAKDILSRVRSLAAGLYSLGVTRGDRVAILSESRPEWTLIDGACLFAGAIDVPIYPTLSPPQVKYILQDSGARVLALQNEQQLLRLREVIEDCHSIEHVVIMEGRTTDTSILQFVQLEERGRSLGAKEVELLDRWAQQTLPDDLATIIYTSGTTGEPKGVMLTHANIVSNLIDTSSHLAFTKDDCCLSVLPLSHVFERVAMYMYLYHGMAIYYAESLETIGPNLREVRPTILVGVPRIFEKIYARVEEKTAAEGRLNAALLNWAISVGKQYARFATRHRQVPRVLASKRALADKLVFSKMRRALGDRIRMLVSGGAALPEELALTYLGAGLPIVQGYGLTETSPVITAGSFEDNRVGTVGRPIPNVAVRIATDGEIEVRGPNVMRGYYNKPQETRAVFTEDGWFKTGDIGTIDEDGFLRITDRKKELFKTSGGKYIAPQPIEELIKASSFVNQVVLIGNGRKFPAALIVPNWERLESYAKLKNLNIKSREEFCRHPRIIDLFIRQIAALTPDLAQYERVKKIALLEDELTIEGGELTPTLKVKRRVIDEKYKKIIDRLYAETQSEG